MKEHVGQKLSMQNAFLFAQIPQTSSTQSKFHEKACAAQMTPFIKGVTSLTLIASKLSPLAEGKSRRNLSIF